MTGTKKGGCRLARQTFKDLTRFVVETEMGAFLRVGLLWNAA